jgi:hypothetical protein
VSVAQDYQYPAGIAHWVLPDDATAVSGNMFAAMWPLAMAKDVFLVPFMKKGEVVGQFRVVLQDTGSWAYLDDGTESFRAGQLFELQAATDELRRRLGPQATVRPVVFVPSGLVFAVGDNEGREAAVLLGHSWEGPGIGDFDQAKVPPVGTLLTPAELRSLLLGSADA